MKPNSGTSADHQSDDEFGFNEDSRTNNGSGDEAASESNNNSSSGEEASIHNSYHPHISANTSASESGRALGGGSSRPPEVLQYSVPASSSPPFRSSNLNNNSSLQSQNNRGTAPLSTSNVVDSERGALSSSSSVNVNFRQPTDVAPSSRAINIFPSHSASSSSNRVFSSRQPLSIRDRMRGYNTVIPPITLKLNVNTPRTWREMSTGALVTFFEGFNTSYLIYGGVNVSTNYALTTLPLLAQSAVAGVGPYFCAGVVLPIVHTVLMDEAGIVINQLNYRPILWKNIGLNIVWSGVACGFPVAIEAIFGDYLASNIAGMSVGQQDLTRQFTRGTIAYFGTALTRKVVEGCAGRYRRKKQADQRGVQLASADANTKFVELDENAPYTWRENTSKPAMQFCLGLTVSYVIFSTANVTDDYTLTKFPLLAQSVVKGMGPFFCSEVVIPLTQKVFMGQRAVVNHNDEARPTLWQDIGSGVVWTAVAGVTQLTIDSIFGNYLEPYVVGLSPGQQEITRQLATGAVAYFATKALRAGLGFFADKCHKREMRSYHAVGAEVAVEDAVALRSGASGRRQ